MRYLDFENERYEKGYEQFQVSRESLKSNIGKVICYVTSRDIDPHRGRVFTQYGKIEGLYRNQLVFESGSSVNFRDIIECGIKIESKESTSPIQ